MDLAALARTHIATVDTDCKSAFDCCVTELIKIKMLAMGVPEKPVRFLYNHLTQMTFDVLAGGFRSKERYGGENSSFGSGQGGGASGFHWLITLDASNKALENHNIKGCVITDPITGETKSNNGIVFADDLTQIAMSNVTLRTPADNLSRLTNITQLANNNLRASGGLSPSQNAAFEIYY